MESREEAILFGVAAALYLPVYLHDIITHPAHIHCKNGANKVIHAILLTVNCPDKHFIKNARERETERCEIWDSYNGIRRDSTDELLEINFVISRDK